MATRMYPTRDASALYSPASWKGAWDGGTGLTGTGMLKTQRSGSGAVTTINETSTSATFDQPVCRFVSDPLAANTSISGTFDGIFLCRETAAAANMVLHLHVWVTTGDSATVRGTLITDYLHNQEWVVHASDYGAITIPQQTVSSVSALAGDRIVVELGYQAQNTDATSYGGSIRYSGDVSDATGAETGEIPNGSVAPWVQFSATLTFKPTYLYTTDTATPVTPGATRGTWSVTGSAVDRLMATTKAGSVTVNTAAETSATNPTDVLCVRFVSALLATQTISGSVIMLIRQIESATTADCFQKVHMYVMEADGSVRGTLLSNQVAGAELSTITVNATTYSMSSVSAQDGDRLVLEVGGRMTNTSTSSMSTIIRTGATTGDAFDAVGITDDDMSGWIRIANGLTFYVQSTEVDEFVFGDSQALPAFRAGFSTIETRFESGDSSIGGRFRVGTIV